MSLKIIYGNRRFIPLFWTQLFAVLNFNLFRNALIILVAYKGVRIAGIDSNAIVALSPAIAISPVFLFSSLAGQLADKFDKSSLVRLVRLGEMLVMLLAAIGFYTDNYGLLLLVLFLLGVTATFFGPLKFGIIPDLVKESELVSANGYIVSSTFLAVLIGTVSGGVATTQEYVTPFLIAATLSLTAFGTLSSWFLPPTNVHASDLKIEWRPLKPILKILAQMRSDRPVFDSICCMSWYWLFAGVLVTLLPILTKDNLHADKDVVTLLLAMFGLGIGAGAVLCEKLSCGRVEIGLIPLSAAGMGAAVLDLSLLGYAWPPVPDASPLVHIEDFLSHGAGWRVLIDVFLFAALGGCFVMPLYSFVQQRSDPAFIARAMAGNNFLNALFGVAGAVVVAGLISLKVSVPTVWIVLVVLNLAALLYLLWHVPEFALRFLSWMLAGAMYRIRVDGTENLPQRGPAVLVCNHVSTIDWIVLHWACQLPVRFVMNSRQDAGPLLRLLHRHAGTVFLSEAMGSAQHGYPPPGDIPSTLRSGCVLGIFPERSISETGCVGPFAPAMDTILARHQAPAVPMAMVCLPGGASGPSPTLPLLRALPWHRREIFLHVGAPAAPGERNAAGMRRLVAHCRHEAEIAAHQAAEAAYILACLG